MPLYRKNNEIPLNFSEIYGNATGGAWAHARLLLEAMKFSGEISIQPMVDPRISDVEDSDGGGLDGR
jgi:hypothetical protein